MTPVCLKMHEHIGKKFITIVSLISKIEVKHKQLQFYIINALLKFNILENYNSSQYLDSIQVGSSLTALGRLREQIKQLGNSIKKRPEEITYFAIESLDTKLQGYIDYLKSPVYQLSVDI